MKYRKLGNTGFDVSEIGFGTWQIGGKRWSTLSRQKNIDLLCEARGLGINIFDASTVYGQYIDTSGYTQSESQELSVVSQELSMNLLMDYMKQEYWGCWKVWVELLIK